MVLGGLYFGIDAVTVTMPPVAAQEAMAGRQSYLTELMALRRVQRAA